jgi:hypothetical protein
MLTWGTLCLSGAVRASVLGFEQAGVLFELSMAAGAL